MIEMNNNFCECNCGQEVKKDNRFIRGHNGRIQLKSNYEEKYGIDRAKEIKEKLRISHIGKPREDKYIVLTEIRYCNCGCKKSKEVKVTSKWKAYQGHYMKLKSPTFWGMRYCECKCGETFYCRIKDPRKFIRGHARRKGVYKICKLCNNEYWIQDNEEKKGIKQDYCSRKCAKKTGIWIKKVKVIHLGKEENLLNYMV